MMNRSWRAVLAVFPTVIALGAAQAGLAAEHGETPSLPPIGSSQVAVDAMAYFQRRVDAHIVSNQLEQLHGYAFAARDAAFKLKDYSASLDEAKREQLDEHLARVKSIATQIDKYGDAGKVSEAKQFAGKLKDESEAIQKLVGLTARPDWTPTGASAAGDTTTSGSSSASAQGAGHGSGHHD